MQFELGESRLLLVYVKAQSPLIKRIKVVQDKDPKLNKLKEDVLNGKNVEFATDQEGVLWCSACLCALDIEDLRRVILE